jgi:hypothetical protein
MQVSIDTAVQHCEVSSSVVGGWRDPSVHCVPRSWATHRWRVGGWRSRLCSRFALVLVLVFGSMFVQASGTDTGC